MIKKTYRKAIDEQLFAEPEEQKVERKLKTIINLLNRCISNCISIPEGYYLCSRCKAKDVIDFHPRIKTFYSNIEGNCFLLSVCKKCDGVGYVDFVSNVIEQPKTKKAYHIPFCLLALPKLEIASIIFYKFYFTKYFSEISTNFNFKNNHGKKTVTEFIEHFIPYKKGREKRIKFLEKNFDELRKRILEVTKFTDVPSNKIACKICNSNPIDIYHDPYNDVIRVKICGNCYGYGFQSKRDTKMTGNYLFDVENPDYNNKKKMLRAILETADLNRAVFMLNIGRMEYKDKKKSK